MTRVDLRSRYPMFWNGTPVDGLRVCIFAASVATVACLLSSSSSASWSLSWLARLPLQFLLFTPASFQQLSPTLPLGPQHSPFWNQDHAIIRPLLDVPPWPIASLKIGAYGATHGARYGSRNSQGKPCPMGRAARHDDGRTVHRTAGRHGSEPQRGNGSSLKLDTVCGRL